MRSRGQEPGQPLLRSQISDGEYGDRALDSREERGTVMKLYRTLALAALLAVGAVGTSFASSAKTAKSAHKVATTAAVQYECKMCHIKLSAKEAKAHSYKCPDCGMKLTLVKKPAKTGVKSKKA